MVRFLALLVLATLVGGGYYYWRGNPEIAAPRDLDEVGARLKDTALTAGVRTALSLHRDLAVQGLSASTEGRVVTLRGTVPRPELREAAERVAGAVPDIRQVVNHIAVDGSAVPAAPSDGRTVGERLDDEALVVRVRLAFSLNRDLAGSRIEVTAHRKEVRLAGRLPGEARRRLALQVAREVAGVESVADALETVEPAAAGSGAAAVARALEANSNLDASGIRVSEEGGSVVLAGQVGSGVERDLAGLLAREAAGKPVENRLEIRGSDRVK